MVSGAGVYFDGKTSARHDVAVDAAPDLLRIRAQDGPVLAEWLYGELQALSAPDDVLRLGRTGNPVLARLEIRDAALAAAIDELAQTVDRSGKTERRTRQKVVIWTVAATVSLVAVAIVGVPLVVERLAPLIPLSVEHRLGVAVDKQVRAILDTSRRSGRPFECGTAESELKGNAALGKIVRALEDAARLPAPLKVVLVRRSEANAIALPGGHVYVFEGLVKKSESPDELAGVLAHEIGHVAHRDGTRSVLRAAGLSFLFGMLLGDFTGGGVAVIAARTIMQSAYTREVEAAADLYGVQLMANIGGDPRALGKILDRIAGAIEPGIKILLDHPQTKDRIAAINAAAPAVIRKPLLAPDEWTALRRICE
jgi:Zn-dependent protease with chaperone function